MRTAERTIIGIIVAGVLSTSLLVLSFVPPAKALPSFHSFIRGGSNHPNTMSADEQPYEPLNGMKLIIDGEQLNGVVTTSSIGCTVPMQQRFCIRAYFFMYLVLQERAFICFPLAFGLDESSLCAASRLAEDKTWLFELELLQCNRCSTIFLLRHV